MYHWLRLISFDYVTLFVNRFVTWLSIFVSTVCAVASSVRIRVLNHQFLAQIVRQTIHTVAVTRSFVIHIGFLHSCRAAFATVFVDEEGVAIGRCGFLARLVLRQTEILVGVSESLHQVLEHDAGGQGFGDVPLVESKWICNAKINSVIKIIVSKSW